MKLPITRVRILLTALVASLLFVTGAMAAAPEAAPDSEHSITPDRVIASLNQTLAWYRRRAWRCAPWAQSSRESERMRRQRSPYSGARSKRPGLRPPSWLPRAAPPRRLNALEAGPLAGKRAEVNAAIQADQREVERLRQVLRTAPAARRAAVQDDLAAATNRLDLDRARLDFLTRLEESNVSSPDTDADLGRQIQALQESVPELRSTNASSPPGTPRRVAQRVAAGARSSA